MATENGTVEAVRAGAMVKAEPRDAIRAFEPNSLEEAYRLSKIFVASRLLPKSIPTPEAAFTIIATGRELGLTAMQSIRSIHVIEGKPTLSADLMLALVKKYPACRFFRMVESSERVATYETHREGEPEPTRMSFTWEDAQRAGVTGKDNWKKYPAAMLRARAITSLVRAVYPDAFMAVYDPDELADAAPPAQLRTAPIAIDVDVTPTPATVVPRDEQAQAPASLSEDSSDRWLEFSKQKIAAIDEASSLEELKSHLTEIKTIPEPFLRPVREAYNARKRALGGAP